MQEAAKAVKEMDKYRLDKSHLVRVYLVDDLDRLEQVPLEYQEPPTVAFDAEVLILVLAHSDCIYARLYIKPQTGTACRNIVEQWHG